MLTYPLVLLSWREKVWSEGPMKSPRIPSAPVAEG